MLGDFDEFATATLYEVVGDDGLLDPTIRPVVPNMRLCGRAFTVRTKPNDSLPILKALELAEMGDVIVAETGNTVFSTVWGASSSRMAVRKGLAGFLCDGAVRDFHDLVAVGLPVFCRGIYAKGTSKEYPGEFGIPVTIGGVEIHKGDIVVADADGVIRILRSLEETTLKLAKEQRERERRRDERVDQGESLLFIVMGSTTIGSTRESD